MQEVTRQQVTTCLKTLGIAPGDGLLVHSAVQFLGRPVGGLQMYLDAIQEAIGARRHAGRTHVQFWLRPRRKF